MNTRDMVLTERASLCDLMDELGPDAPTWCGEWSTADLAAHLVVRETRPDAGPGLMVGGMFARYTEKVRSKKLGSTSYSELVEHLRDGPPRLWPGRYKPDVDVHEWFVHHEDVRRANGHDERVGDAELDEAVWGSLKRWGPLLTRSLDVGVVLQTPSGASRRVRTGDETVTLTARPGELMLRLFGRSVEVEIDGDDSAVRRFDTAELGF